jgi:hypothetical protein
MARKNDLNPGALFLILVVGGIGAAFSALTKAVGIGGILILGAVVIVIPCVLVAARRGRRLSYLRTKYSDEQIVQRIMRRSYWDGQSAEQLLDSLGQPSGVDRQVMKTKQREVWKYSPVGKNRYKLRITLDQGQVVGWDAKGHA